MNGCKANVSERSYRYGVIAHMSTAYVYALQGEKWGCAQCKETALLHTALH